MSIFQSIDAVYPSDWCKYPIDSFLVDRMIDLLFFILFSFF